uniref:Uncharacterized protein n=1 Tax=Anguilla anguilla TaxID=7936 RepID=A0A0E9U3V6_ANGAN
MMGGGMLYWLALPSSGRTSRGLHCGDGFAGSSCSIFSWTPIAVSSLNNKQWGLFAL